MIINVLANGDIKNIVPENIYQGSNKANTIVLIAPFSASVTPTISFELPQTHEIKGGATGYLFNEPTEVSNTLNMWTLQVDEVLTQYYGDVKYQVKFVNSNNEVIATARGKFKVNEGVDFELPATPSQDVYELLLQKISDIRADFLNGWIEAVGIKEYNSDFAYGLGSYVLGVVNDKTMIYKSLIENNKGNELTDTNAWQVVSMDISAETIGSLIEDTESIVSMVDGDKLKFELNADLTSQIFKSLTVPMKAPLSTELVAVDDGNSQTMVEIGDGLKLENGVLSATTQADKTVTIDTEQTITGNKKFTGNLEVVNEGHIVMTNKTSGASRVGGAWLDNGVVEVGSTDTQGSLFRGISHNAETRVTDISGIVTINGKEVATEDIITQALANYYTKNENYSKEEVDNLVTSIPKFDIKVVDSLPTSNISNTTIYLVVSGTGTPNLYDEYIYVNNQWEFLGSQTTSVGNAVTVDTPQTITGQKTFNNGIVVEKSIDNGSSGVTNLTLALDGRLKVFTNRNSLESRLGKVELDKFGGMFIGSSTPSGSKQYGIKHSVNGITNVTGTLNYNGVEVATKNDIGTGGSSVNVVDNLTSQSGTDALSAKQGNVLYNMIVDIDNSIKTAIQDTWGASY
jgi:hypothetical protein